MIYPALTLEFYKKRKIKFKLITNYFAVMSAFAIDKEML